MSEYTPTTEEVRDAYVGDNGLWEQLTNGASGESPVTVAMKAEFARWLAEVERAAAEKAWREGELAGTRSQRDFNSYRQDRITAAEYESREAGRSNPYLLSDVTSKVL